MMHHIDLGIHQADRAVVAFTMCSKYVAGNTRASNASTRFHEAAYLLHTVRQGMIRTGKPSILLAYMMKPFSLAHQGPSSYRFLLVFSSSAISTQALLSPSQVTTTWSSLHVTATLFTS